MEQDRPVFILKGQTIRDPEEEPLDVADIIGPTATDPVGSKVKFTRDCNFVEFEYE